MSLRYYYNGLSDNIKQVEFTLLQIIHLVLKVNGNGKRINRAKRAHDSDGENKQKKKKWVTINRIC